MKSLVKYLLCLSAIFLPLISHAQFARFQGTWAPSQPDGEFVRAVIHGKTVQLFSPCSPAPCNWGEDAAQGYWSSSEAAASTAASAMVVSRDTVTDHVIVVITPVGKDLRMDVYTRFAEGDKRRPYFRTAIFHATAGKAAGAKAAPAP